jgi:predicted RNA-binding Zn-ribbon protein involved in translation (DUF1610 family)
VDGDRQHYPNRCPYCKLEIEELVGDSFECPRCGGTGAVRANDRRRYIVAAELVARVDADARRDAERASGRGARTAVELRAQLDGAAGEIADARSTGSMVRFSPAAPACRFCAQLEGRYGPDAVPSLPVRDCTGDGWATDCRCSIFVSGESLWEHREAVIIEALWDARGLSSVEELAAWARLSLDSAKAGLRSLVELGYVTGQGSVASTYDKPIRLRPRGLREIGDWPWERGHTGLVAVLEYMAVTASDQQEDWAQLLSAVRRAGRHVMEDVVYAALRAASRDVA